MTGTEPLNIRFPTGKRTGGTLEPGGPDQVLMSTADGCEWRDIMGIADGTVKAPISEEMQVFNDTVAEFAKHVTVEEGERLVRFLTLGPRPANEEEK